MPAGLSRVVYALVSDVRMDGSSTARLTFGDDEPSLEVLSPADGGAFSEEDLVEFLAVASGLGGEDPDAVVVKWTYTRHDGSPFSFFSDNGETVTHRFCDGSYTVVVEAVNAITSETVSDHVDITVANASPPPPECAPSATILAPSDGDTFALGASIQFGAQIDDDHPETDDAIYPLTWRDGGPAGTVIAQDTLAFARDDLSAGTHVIHFQYGTASDSVTIAVVDTSNEAPSANITSPADGSQFSYVDLGASPQVVFTGTGSDPEDGPLSGASLAWSYLREGSTQWQDAGAGASFTLFVVYGSDNATTYRVRLRATDSEGLFDVHEIQISVLNPPI